MFSEAVFGFPFLQLPSDSKMASKYNAPQSIVKNRKIVAKKLMILGKMHGGISAVSHKQDYHWHHPKE
jgi:hypothetical protein